jgi:aryl-alcohol dehydrogenase-like predicted oxidoreductase
VAQPVVSSVISRATSPVRLRTDAEAAKWGLYPEDLEGIDRITHALLAF